MVFSHFRDRAVSIQQHILPPIATSYMMLRIELTHGFVEQTSVLSVRGRRKLSQQAKQSNSVATSTENK